MAATNGITAEWMAELDDGIEKICNGRFHWFVPTWSVWNAGVIARRDAHPEWSHFKILFKVFYDAAVFYYCNRVFF